MDHDHEYTLYKTKYYMQYIVGLFYFLFSLLFRLLILRMLEVLQQQGLFLPVTLDHYLYRIRSISSTKNMAHGRQSFSVVRSVKKTGLTLVLLERKPIQQAARHFFSHVTEIEAYQRLTKHTHHSHALWRQNHQKYSATVFSAAYFSSIFDF